MHNQLIQILTRLVEINSVNPDLSATGVGERDIAIYVNNYFKELGISSKVHTIASDRCNVIAVLNGTNPDYILLLNGHLDTVGVEGMNDPFTLRQEGDKLFGRGTYDMLAGCAVQMGLADYFSKHPCPITVAFTFVADEENLSIGMEHLVEHFLPTLPDKPILGIFLEPTEEQVGICHKGFAWFEMIIEGLAAHGSRPEEGIDAILPMGAALKELEAINKELAAEDPHPYLGNATLHPGVVSGGTSQSVIAAEAKLTWERRILPSEEMEKLDQELQRVFSAVQNSDGKHKVNAQQVFYRPPHEASENELILKLKQTAGNKDCVGLSYWADSALAAKAGIPSVLFGPAGHGAHAKDEWVSAESLFNTYDTLRKFILELE